MVSEKRMTDLRNRGMACMPWDGKNNDFRKEPRSMPAAVLSVLSVDARDLCTLFSRALPVI